jgi:hypothetical protein
MASRFVAKDPHVGEVRHRAIRDGQSTSVLAGSVPGQNGFGQVELHFSFDENTAAQARIGTCPNGHIVEQDGPLDGDAFSTGIVNRSTAAGHRWIESLGKSDA